MLGIIMALMPHSREPGATVCDTDHSKERISFTLFEHGKCCFPSRLVRSEKLHESMWRTIQILLFYIKDKSILSVEVRI